MAYPYLPVNPCCTDVVINDVCGCSSTITNSGCNTNNPCSTTLTASSTIVYNGPALTCTTAEPCDTLNVILQKIDEIICNLLSQINILTTQVSNLNSQITTINNDITNIYDVLDVCCVTTTTTTTTVNIPCESFLLTNTGVTPLAIIITDCITGLEEAIVLLPGDTEICVETDSPLVVPGTVIATPTGPCETSTTTSTSSSTTTTTTTFPCECLTFNNTDTITHSFTYIDCSGNISAGSLLEHEVLQVCGCCGEADSAEVTISIGANCVDGLCPLVLNDCSILVNAVNGDIIGYDVDTNQSEVLASLAFSNDMANTPTKMWLYDNLSSIIKEYNITLNPWTYSFYRDINFPVGVTFGAGLGAISNTRLITTNTLTLLDTIIEIDITGPTATVVSTIASLPPGYQISGDILATLTGKIICLANSGIVYKLFQFDKLTGLQELAVDISSSIGSEFPLGLAENNNTLYILCSEGSVYEVNLTTPYGLTLVNVGDFTVSGASQSPECATVNLIVPTTTTTTTTVYPYPCSCVHVTISQTDLDDATGNTPGPGKADNTVYITTTKNSGCDGSNIDNEYTTAGLDGFCIKTSEIGSIQLFYYKNNVPVYFPATDSTYNILYTSCSVNGECIPA